MKSLPLKFDGFVPFLQLFNKIFISISKLNVKIISVFSILQLRILKKVVEPEPTFELTLVNLFNKNLYSIIYLDYDALCKNYFNLLAYSSERSC